MILGQDFLRKSISVTLCSLLGSLMTLLLLGRKCQALKSRNLRGTGREGLMAAWSLYQRTSTTSRPLQSSSEGCYCCLGLSDTSSPGPTQDPRGTR